MNTPRPNDIYRHFKGNTYRVLTLAQDAETGERVVVYQALYGHNEVYTRPLSGFLERLDSHKYPYAEQIHRFEPLDNPMSPGRAFDIGEYDEPAPRNASPIRNAAPPKDASPIRNAAPSQNTAPSRNAATERPTTPSRPDAQPPDLDPLLIEFLDNAGHQERLDILSRLRQRLTPEMINIMAVALETELQTPSDMVDQAYNELRSYLLTMEKYERKHR